MCGPTAAGWPGTACSGHLGSATTVISCLAGISLKMSAFPLYFALRARVGCLLALLCLFPFVHYLLSFTTVNSKYSLVFCLSACIQYCVWSLGTVSHSVFAATLQRGHSDFDLKAGSPLPPSCTRAGFPGGWRLLPRPPPHPQNSSPSSPGHPGWRVAITLGFSIFLVFEYKTFPWCS